MGIDLLRKSRKIVEFPWPGFEDAISKQFSPEEQRVCMLLVVHQIDQAKARDPTRQMAIVDDGLEVLLARGLGSPGLETIRALWPSLTPDEQALVARGSTLQASVTVEGLSALPEVPCASGLMSAVRQGRTIQ